MEPAHSLLGQDLPNGWKVIEKVTRKPTATGAHFSVGYIVQKASGERGYLKAMDYTAAFQHHRTAEMLQIMTNAFVFEKSVCERCRDSHLRRIVHAIDSGSLQTDPTSPYSKVEYLVFELADGDVRAHLDTQAQFDLAFALRTLHDVAVGLEQLHRAGMAHQDLKPSNVLVFATTGERTKIGDFGRAWARDFTAPHDSYPVAGDRGYAPPELLYNSVATDIPRRRFGCDAYHLGSLVVFFFTRVNINALLVKYLAREHWPGLWTGTYDAVLPYVQAAFGSAISEFSSQTPEFLRDDLVDVVRQLCEPEPTLRGHPLNRQGYVPQFALDRFISKFNLLARKAELKLIGV